MLLLIFIINFVMCVLCNEQKKNSSSPWCQSKRITKNCSCQVHGNHSSVCQSNSECKPDFLMRFERQSDDQKNGYEHGFAVDAVPYVSCLHPMQNYPFPAINFTFTAVSDEIEGFVFYLLDDLVQSNPYNACRILNFRTLATRQKQVSLSYDCLKIHLSSSGYFQFHIQALPSKEELKYRLFLPNANEIEPATACDWSPLIFVPLKIVKDNVVEVKFSQAPAYLNVTNYDVRLSIKNNEEYRVIRKISVSINLKMKSIAVVFKDLDIGYYYINVNPMSENLNCKNRLHRMIFVEGQSSGDKTIIYICSVIACCVAICLVIFLLFRHFLKPRATSFSDSVLVVYSYDFEEHEAAVESLCLLLKRFCNNVTTIYSRNKDPNDWLDVNYQKASVIIIVISYGVCHKLQNENLPPIVEKHSWGNRFTPAIKLLHSELYGQPLKKKKFIRVYFEYSKTQQIPLLLQSSAWGRIFALPNEMGQLLSYLVNDSITCCFSASKLSIAQIINSSSSEVNNLHRTIYLAEETLRKTVDSSIFFENSCKTIRPSCNQSEDSHESVYLDSDEEGKNSQVDSQTLLSRFPLEPGPSFWDTLLNTGNVSSDTDESSTKETSRSFWDTLCPILDDTLPPNVSHSSSLETLDATSNCQNPNSNQQSDFWSNFELHQGQI